MYVGVTLYKKWDGCVSTLLRVVCLPFRTTFHSRCVMRCVSLSGLWLAFKNRWCINDTLDRVTVCAGCQKSWFIFKNRRCIGVHLIGNRTESFHMGRAFCWVALTDHRTLNNKWHRICSGYACIARGWRALTHAWSLWNLCSVGASLGRCFTFRRITFTYGRCVHVWKNGCVCSNMGFDLNWFAIKNVRLTCIRHYSAGGIAHTSSGFRRYALKS